MGDAGWSSIRGERYGLGGSLVSRCTEVTDSAWRNQNRNTGNKPHIRADAVAECPAHSARRGSMTRPAGDPGQLGDSSVGYSLCCLRRSSRRVPVISSQLTLQQRGVDLAPSDSGLLPHGDSLKRRADAAAH